MMTMTKSYRCHAINVVNMQSGQTSAMLAVAWCVSELLVKFCSNRHYDIKFFKEAESTCAQGSALSFSNNMGTHRLEEVLRKPTYQCYPHPNCF